MSKKINKKTTDFQNEDQLKERNQVGAQNDQIILIEKLRAALKLAKEKERRAMADYHNLVRRNQAEQARIAKFATLNFVETILEPLEHLSLAAMQLNDAGLNMVIDRLWEKLSEAGLEEINPIKQKFDVETMEAVRVGEGSNKNNKGIVKKVIAKGYQLNGEVIRHAKVIVD